MKFCPQCGTEHMDVDVYCKQCGVRLVSDGAVRSSSEQNSDPIAAGSTPAEEGEKPDAPEIPGFFDAAKIGFKKYCCFKGRASRSEFLYWILFVSLINFAIALNVVPKTFLVDLLNWSAFFSKHSSLEEVASSFSSFVLRAQPISQLWLTALELWFLVIFFPTISVLVRRAHDLNVSGWRLGIVGMGIGTGLTVLNSGFMWMAMKKYSGVIDWRIMSYGACIVGLLVIVSIVLLYSCERGIRGENRFGLEPQKKRKGC